MKLLIITQKVDSEDSVLGFMHHWIIFLSQKFESVIVVCLYEGAHSLPRNVRVLSLGKEKKHSKFFYLLNFYKYIWDYRREYDSVFVHMNQIYVILGGLLWRLLSKKICLWYAHGHIPLSLRIAEKITHRILTSTKSGCRIKSNKIKIIGQGIATDFFTPAQTAHHSGVFRLVSAGRITPSKDYATLFEALKILKQKNLYPLVALLGGTATDADNTYKNELEKRLATLGIGEQVSFVGPVPNRDLVEQFHRAELFVSMGLTGSLDKAVLEAMSSGLPVLTCNEAFLDVIPANLQGMLMYQKRNAAELAERIAGIIHMENSKWRELGAELRSIVVRDHGLPAFIEKVADNLK